MSLVQPTAGIVHLQAALETALYALTQIELIRRRTLPLPCGE